MNKIKAELLSLEKKLRACPDSKQNAIDKDIFNLLVAMTKRMEELEKEMEEMEEMRNPAEELLAMRKRIYANDKFFKDDFQDIYTWKDIVKNQR